jgi:hypothetical protein
MNVDILPKMRPFQLGENEFYCGVRLKTLEHTI